VVSQGTVWTGKVWYIYEMNKYEFALSFDIPISYPATSPELALPELDGMTAKMYRGGKICLTVSFVTLAASCMCGLIADRWAWAWAQVHFNPLWQRNVPKFGIAHAMALGMGPWLAAEVPDLVAKGLIQPAADK
jgi:ufm1-conjugating enzyme 1